MLVNCSNHPYEIWSEKQKKAASVFGSVVDLPFPAIDVQMEEADIENIANEIFGQIVILAPDCVMCQGEFTLTYRLVNKLKQSNIQVIAACSERSVTEELDEEGKVHKSVVFDFVRFRRY